MIVNCPCGKQHTMRDEAWAMATRLIEATGEDAVIHIDGRMWIVPKWYIANHGLRAQDLLNGRVSVAREVPNGGTDREPGV